MTQSRWLTRGGATWSWRAHASLAYHRRAGGRARGGCLPCGSQGVKQAAAAMGSTRSPRASRSPRRPRASGVFSVVGPQEEKGWLGASAAPGGPRVWVTWGVGRARTTAGCRSANGRPAVSPSCAKWADSLRARRCFVGLAGERAGRGDRNAPWC